MTNDKFVRIPVCQSFSIITLLFALSAIAAEKPPVILVADLKTHGPVDFAKEVLPILRKNCLACHGNVKPKAELDLENPPAIRKGGENGKVVILGKGAESSLIKMCSGQDEIFMPPLKNNVGALALTPEQLGILKLWIDQGALGDVHAGEDALVWRPLPAGLNAIFAVDITPDAQLAACARANQISIYNLGIAQLAARLADPELNKDGLGNAAERDYVQSLAFSPDGQLLASGGYRCVKLWRKQPLVERMNLNDRKAKPSPVKCLAVHAPSHRLAKGLADGRVEVWDSDAGKLQWTLAAHSSSLNAAAFSADGVMLFTGSSDHMIRIWNAADGGNAGEIFSPVDVTAIAYNDELRKVVSGGADNLIRIWGLPTRSDYEALPERELKGHNAPIAALEFAAGGKQLLSSAADNSLIQWNFADGAQMRKFDHGAPIAAFARALGCEAARDCRHGEIEILEWRERAGTCRSQRRSRRGRRALCR